MQPCFMSEREREREREGGRKRKRITHADRLTRVQACFLLAMVHAPYSPVRQRERERKKEGVRE